MTGNTFVTHSHVLSGAMAKTVELGLIVPLPADDRRRP